MRRPANSAEPAPAVALSDGGLQVERTALAWRRTGCSLVIFVLIGIRVTAARGGAYVALSLIALGAATAAIVLVGLLRPASLHQRLAVTDDGVIHLRSATAGRALLMSVSVSLLGLAAIALVVDGAP